MSRPKLSHPPWPHEIGYIHDLIFNFTAPVNSGLSWAPISIHQIIHFPKNALMWNTIWKLEIVLSNPSVLGYDAMGGKVWRSWLCLKNDIIIISKLIITSLFLHFPRPSSPPFFFSTSLESCSSETLPFASYSSVQPCNKIAYFHIDIFHIAGIFCGRGRFGTSSSLSFSRTWQ